MAGTAGPRGLRGSPVWLQYHRQRQGRRAVVRLRPRRPGPLRRRRRGFLAHGGASRVTEAYYSQPRADVAALVPDNAQRILDVGCGFGALGRGLIATKPRIMHGIERNAAAASRLEGLYQRYVVADAEAGLAELREERYHCIVFADVLEHLVDPWSVLRKATQLLIPGGVVVASIPNVRNIAVIFNLLLRGRWRYQDSGLL